MSRSHMLVQRPVLSCMYQIYLLLPLISSSGGSPSVTQRINAGLGLKSELLSPSLKTTNI